VPCILTGLVNPRYPVGRAVYEWGGPRSRADSTHEPAGDRELVVWVWYPAAPGPTAMPAAYLPQGWEVVGQFLGFQADAVRSHAVEDAPLAPAPARFPVLLFSPAGFPPLALTAILEEIASHGYVIVGLNHTRESAITVFSDGRVVPMDAELMQPVLGPLEGAPEDAFQARADIANTKAADMRFVVDQLEQLVAGELGADRMAGRLDLARLGAFGHSLGGNAALEYCRLDGRCAAAANLDGANWSEVGRVGLTRPVLQILADHSELQLPCKDQVEMGVYPTVAWCGAERTLMRGGWQTVHEQAQPGYGVLITGTGHASFLDLPFLPLVSDSRAAAGLAAVRINGLRAWRITCDYLLAFFAKHVLGTKAPLLDGAAAPYPEARFGAPEDLLTGPAVEDPNVE
jgi:Platelet-activating factor acetylhydrolase, isoform II